MRGISRRVATLMFSVLAGLALLTGIAGADASPWTTISTNFTSPLFGLANAPNGQLVVADAGAGPTRLQLSNGATSVITPLTGVTDVALLSSGDMYASTSGIFGSSGFALYRVSGGNATKLADLMEFEQKNDPAKDGVDSDPFDLARLGGKVYIADAAANDILVYEGGKLDWVASIPQHTGMSTEWLKRASGCPNGPDDICKLPARMDADPVPTSVAVGPDGFLYIGELTGFPATPEQSRIWRLDPNARHVVCGQSPSCTLVKTGFTSIIDIIFGPDGKAYVVELDERSWLAAENGFGTGGTVNVCSTTWVCTARNTQLPFPTAVALKDGKLYSTLFSVIPGQAQVAFLP
jgi:hypothetical protein